MINIEIRADGAHIFGYVNATGKPSRPVMTPRGKVVEVIEERTFEGALTRAGEITVSVDHDTTHIYASTKDGSCNLYEDAIGFHADVLVTDPHLIELAKAGKIRGWSFGMYNVVDTLEERANDLPLRRITSLDLDHITLVVNKVPCYSATSVEVRAEEEVVLETRAAIENPQITVVSPQPSFDRTMLTALLELLS